MSGSEVSQLFALAGVFVVAMIGVLYHLFGPPDRPKHNRGSETR
jgi:hypothetical protein